MGSIWKSQYVILRDQRGVFTLQKVPQKDTPIQYGKAKATFPPALIRDKPYGSHFHSEKGILKKRPPLKFYIHRLLSELDIDSNDQPNDAGYDGDEGLDDGGNHLFDDNEAQCLDQKTIMKMKATLPTMDLIRALCENSKSFRKRTIFSKEKYINKSLERHSDEFSILEPNLTNLLKLHGERDDGMKVGGIRAETLGLMMSRCNIGVDSHTLVFDHARGSLVSRIAQLGVQSLYRIDAHGVTTTMCEEVGINKALFPEDMKFPLSLCLRASYEPPNEANFHSYCLNDEFLQFVSSKQTIDILVEENNPLRELKLGVYKTGLSKWKARVANWRRLSLFEGVDSFIAVISVNRWCEVDQNTKVLSLPDLIGLALDLGDVATRFVQPGGVLCMFCAEIPPLTSLIAALTDSLSWTDVKMERLTVRPWQVKENRSHPMMRQIKLSKGHIISAVRTDL